MVGFLYGIVGGGQVTVLEAIDISTDAGVINFVTDCGADPSGVKSCAPAFDKAFALLSALGSISPTSKNPLRLFIPPGLYALKSALASPAWNFAAHTTSVEIIGAGVDASIIQLHGFDLPVIQNVSGIAAVSGFTVQGTSLGASNDCSFGIAINASTFGVVEH